ncbi:MAG: flagellar basal body P-ring formation protein FlgA [Betaproteobacteria bacterium HGW-Betaproteobacteria-1]|jgi:flagella basal body P-ring formation protein FlgA|nr:MAG: flagellar basal body P-ring formation protein FlgA [Betaproteobacteria bacterium HGW-Betaproteobacteria-1]
MKELNSEQFQVYSTRIYQAIWLAILACLLMLFASAVSANQGNNQVATQDTAAIRSKVQEFLQVQTMGVPGKVSITVGQVEQHLRLQACSDLEAFLPAGSRAWGRTTVGIKCSQPAAWTIYVQARVNVTGQYLAAAVPLRQGHEIGEQDLMFLTGDLTTLPPSIITEKPLAIGQTVSSSIVSGSVIRQDMLRKPAAVKQGQSVRIISSGKGFSVSAEGQALANASEGQVVRAKTGNGSVISGIARNSGEVIVSF